MKETIDVAISACTALFRLPWIIVISDILRRFIMALSTFMCKQTQVFLSGLKMDAYNPLRHKEKVVIVMGATGTGKSRLSIDLATRFQAEIINSDKMQVYKGLDIVTNKVTEEEQRGVTHHLIGIQNPNVDFTVKDFCDKASNKIESILEQGRLPIIVGGSNSYIEALIDDDDDFFKSKYECCFLWVDVLMPVLYSFVSKRVDQMLEKGMIHEVKKMFNPNVDYARGIRKAIGVPEFDRYFRSELLDKEHRAILLQEAIRQVKENTCKLACRQRGKIQRLSNTKGWDMHQLDATEVFQKHGRDSREADKAWEELVAGPSKMIVGQFLYNEATKFPTHLAAGIKNRDIERWLLANNLYPLVTSVQNNSGMRNK